MHMERERVCVCVWGGGGGGGGREIGGRVGGEKGSSDELFVV